MDRSAFAPRCHACTHIALHTQSPQVDSLTYILRERRRKSRRENSRLDMQVCGRNGVNGFVVVVGRGDVRRDSYTRRLTLNLENLSALAPNLSDPVLILVKATAARSGDANEQALMMSK